MGCMAPTTTEVYRAGKAQPDRYRDAVRILREQSLRKRNGLAVNAAVSHLAWGTIMAAAQVIDPKVNHRHAAIVTLGIRRQDLFG